MTPKELFNKMHPQDGDLPKWAEDLMELYAKEQYNQAIRDADEHIISRLKPIINAQFIYDSIKITKLLK